MPAPIVQAMCLKERDDIELQIAGPRSFAMRKTPEVRERLQRLRQQRGPGGRFKFDWLDVNEGR